MKSKKILSLVLTIMSLVTAFTGLASKAITEEQFILNSEVITEKQRMEYDNILNKVRITPVTKVLYDVILSKRLAPIKRGGTLGANKRYLKMMTQNIRSDLENTDYDETIILFFKNLGMPIFEVNYFIRNLFLETCELLNESLQN